MATEVRHRRGTTAQHATFTGALGEVTVDTDKKTTVVHDGVTPGGTPQLTVTNIMGKANSGANSDITSLSGLTTPLSVAQGGTGGNTQATARTGIAAAARGANSDITSITGLITALPVNQGGSGVLTNTSYSPVLTGTTATGPLKTDLGTGITGQVLTSQGAGTYPIWAAPSALTVATSQATTSGTFKDFTSIPSTVKRITVMLAGVSTNGSNDLIIQLGSGSIQITGYLGSVGNIRANGSSTNVAFSSSFIIAGEMMPGDAYGFITLINMGSDLWTAGGTTGTTGGARNSVVGGGVTLSGAIDRLRISSVGGTDVFDAGVVNIAYE